MKKLLVILLLLVYGGSSFGMTLYFHYCCDTLQEVVLTPPKDDACMEGQQHEMTDVPCCANKEVVLKINDDQTPSQIYFNLDPAPAIAPLYHVVLSNYVMDAQYNPNPDYFTPPPLQKNFSKLYCVYRI